MIVLGPTDSISAGASVASVVNYVIEGEVVATTADATPSFQVLASGQVNSALVQLYGPGAGNQALISRIALHNTSASAVLVTVAESAITTATMSIPANGFSQYEPQSGWTVYSNLGLPVGGGGGGSGGGVSSVNTRTGAVVLKASDVAGGANGTANQLLGTDGAGNGSWVNAPSGGGVSVDVTKNGVTPGAAGTGPDCTAALTTLIVNQVAAAQANGTNYVELFFPPGIYNIKAAPTQGGTTFGNAQIPLPIVAATADKVILVFRCAHGGADSVPHWNQTVGQKAGAVLYTTWAGAYSGTYGAPSVLGGPTVEQGWGNPNAGSFPQYPQFNNIHVVIDGISVVSSTVNPTMRAFDFQGMAQMTVGAAGAFCDVPTSTMNSTVPTHNWTAGLVPPNSGNNDLCNIRSWSCEGFYAGAVITEHCVYESVRTIYCWEGLTVRTEYYGHGNYVGYASVESCAFALTYEEYSHCQVQVLDVEHNHGSLYDGGADINDASGNGRGYVGFICSGPGEGETTPPVVTGGQNLKIVNVALKPMVVNPSDSPVPITVPASTTALKNPFWRDALVHVTGGTVTVITVTVAGVSHVLGITSGAVLVPSGASIAITYSVAPTWVWTVQ